MSTSTPQVLPPAQEHIIEHPPADQGQITEALKSESSLPDNSSPKIDEFEGFSTIDEITKPSQRKVFSFSNLPSEIIMMIGGFLRPKDLQKLLQTCTRFNQLLAQSLVMRACREKKLSTVALFYAAANRNSTLVRTLLEKGTGIIVMEYTRDPDAAPKKDKWRYEIIHETPDQCYDELFEFVLTEAENLVLMWNKKAYTALHWAIKMEDKLLTALLLTKGARLVFLTHHREGSGPLHIAASRWGFSMTYFLLNRGFPVNQRDAENLTALQVILRQQQDSICCKSMVVLLLEKGASVTVRDKWLRTPLHHVACYENWAGLVKTVVDMGADVNAKNRWGATALHIAAKLGNLQVVNELLAAGADVNIVNDQERTAWGLAMEYRRNEVACVLSLFGGSVED